LVATLLFSCYFIQVVGGSDSREKARQDELAFEGRLGKGYARVSQRGSDVGYDLESHDHRHVIETKRWLQSTRDLGAAVLRLARVLAVRNDIQRATLVTHIPRMSAGRLRREWQETQRDLRPDVSRRLSLVAMTA